MANRQSGGRQEGGLEFQADRSALYRASDDVVIRIAYESPHQIRVEMWRSKDGIIVPPEVGNMASGNFRQRLGEIARSYFNPPPKKEKKTKDGKTVEVEVPGGPDTVPNIDEDLGKLATALGVPSVSAMLKEEGGTSVAERLVECAEEAGMLFLTPDGTPHIRVHNEDHVETHAISDTGFRVWLRGYFYKVEAERLREEARRNQERVMESLGALSQGDGKEIEIGVQKPPIVRDQAIADAISQLKSMALFEKRVEEVFLRVGEYEGRVYLDLGNERWDAIEIDAEGWRVVDTPPCNFVRAKGMSEIPYPDEDGNIEDLWEVLTLDPANEDDQDSMKLIKAWLVQALNPRLAEYTILVLQGGQGTGKTSTTRLLRGIVDPSAVSDIRKPRSEEELHIDCLCSWVVAMDNISGVQQWLSDVIARISTGSAMTKRTLYSDRDREIFVACQPQILNGISDVATRGDLLRRSLLVDLPLVGEYVETAVVRRRFREKHPSILGALLDAVSEDLRSIEAGETVSATLPDMADFSKWVLRCEEKLGIEPREFMQAYQRSRVEGNETVLESEPVCATLYEFAESFRGPERAWSGTTEKLRVALNNAQSDESLKRSESWPKDAAALGRIISRTKPSLDALGVKIEDLKRSKEGARKRVYLEVPDTGSSEGDDVGEID